MKNKSTDSLIVSVFVSLFYIWIYSLLWCRNRPFISCVGFNQVSYWNSVTVPTLRFYFYQVQKSSRWNLFSFLKNFILASIVWIHQTIKHQGGRAAKRVDMIVWTYFMALLHIFKQISLKHSWHYSVTSRKTERFLSTFCELLRISFESHNFAIWRV